MKVSEFWLPIFVVTLNKHNTERCGWTLIGPALVGAIVVRCKEVTFQSRTQDNTSSHDSWQFYG